MRIVARAAFTLTAKHSDGGSPTREAEDAVWCAFNGTPPGAHVRLNVGPVEYPSRRMVDLLEDAIGPDGRARARRSALARQAVAGDAAAGAVPRIGRAA